MKNLSILVVLLINFWNLAAQINYRQDQVLVRLVQDEHIENLIRDFSNTYPYLPELGLIKQISKHTNIFQLCFDPSKAEVDQMIRALYRIHGVIDAQKNHLVKNRDTNPNDANFNQQWWHKNLGGNGGTPDSDIDSELAWDITTGGTTTTGHEIVVCVVDDGTALTHPDLMDNIWTNAAEIPDNNIDDDGNGYVDDYYGWNEGANNENVDNGSHGVNVCGMVGAVGNNATGCSGVNWNVKIMMVVNGSTDAASAIASYDYALGFRLLFNETGGEEGAFVVATNTSWGLDGTPASEEPLWCDFYNTLGEAGIISCGATTNSNLNVDAVGDIPTACTSDYLISVTATDHSDARNFSGYGATTIDVAAPGEDVYTTNNGFGGLYTTTSGTSFASPLVAGMVALLYSAPCTSLMESALTDPAQAALLVKGYILEGVDPVPSLNGDILTGGRVNSSNSLNLLLAECSVGGCSPAYNFTADNITDTNADISWNTFNPVLGFNYILLQSGVEIATGTVASNALSFDFLTGCTNYTLQVQSVCDTINTNYTDFEFATDGCCVPPANITANTSVIGTSVLNWDGVFAAISYNIRFRPISGGAWTTITDQPLGAYSLQPLNDCTSYEVQLQTNCNNGTTSDWSNSITFVTLGCGACVDLPYCEVVSENNSEEWIGLVQLQDINYTSESSMTGYELVADETTSLAAGETYTISLTPEFGFFTFDEVFRVWIDLNQDGIFSGNELLLTTESVQANIQSEIEIPSNAAIGVTRMRVNMSYFENVNAVCEDLTYGEVEDYCILITPGCDPITLTAIATSSATTICEGEQVQITATGGVYYDWTPATGLSCTDCPNPTASPQEDIIYSVEVTDDMCGIGNATVPITVYPLPQVGITINGQQLVATTGFEMYEWQLDGLPIVSSASNFYVPEQDGIYTAIITDANGCRNESNAINFNYTGISDLPARVAIYPNPVQDILWISMDSYNRYSYSVYNSLGQLISQSPEISNQGIQQLSTKEWSAGIYKMILQLDGKNYAYRFVKIGD